MSLSKDSKQQQQQEHRKRPLRVGSDDAVINGCSNKLMTTNSGSRLGRLQKCSEYSTITSSDTNDGRSNRANPQPFIALSKLRNYMTQHTSSSQHMTDKLTKSSATDSSSSSKAPATIRTSSATKNTCSGISPSKTAVATASPIRALVTSEQTAILTAAEKAAAGYDFSRVPHTSSGKRL